MKRGMTNAVRAYVYREDRMIDRMDRRETNGKREEDNHNSNMRVLEDNTRVWSF